jgi:transposase
VARPLLQSLGMNAQTELNKRVEELQALRDDLKVRIHLASMEAKDAWNELLPKLEKAEKLAESAVVDTAKVALDDVIGSLKQLRDKIGN